MATTQNALKLVFERNNFYKRMYFLALGAFAICLITIVFLFVTFYHLYHSPTEPLYFATDDVTRLIPIIPVNQPNMSTEEVMQWTTKAIEAAFSYDYINYRAQLQDAEKYFTKYGWTQYMKALRSTNNLLALTEDKKIVLARLIEPPKLITEGILAGAYAWKFQMQLLVNYYNPPYDTKSLTTNALILSVIVQRQPILQSNKGLGIVQVIGELPSGTGTKSTTMK